MVAAALSRRAYFKMMCIGYGVGLPLLAFDSFHEIVNLHADFGFTAEHGADFAFFEVL